MRRRKCRFFFYKNKTIFFHSNRYSTLDIITCVGEQTHNILVSIQRLNAYKYYDKI